MHACAPGRPAPTTVSSGHGLGGDWYIFGSSLCKSLGVGPSFHVLTHASTKTMVSTSPNRTPGGTQPANGKHLTGSTGWGERSLQEDGCMNRVGRNCTFCVPRCPAFFHDRHGGHCYLAASISFHTSTSSTASALHRRPGTPPTTGSTSRCGRCASSLPAAWRSAS